MRLDVLYQFNEAYVPFAGTSITSLFENNKNIENIVVHIIEENISSKSKIELIDLFKRYNRKYNFYSSDELVREMERLGIPKYRGSYATNFKMFFSKLIQEKIERLLYIDSDTIVMGDLSELITINMAGNSLAMVIDSLAKNHKCHVGHKKEELYYNAGIILFDVIKWNEENCMEKIVQHVRNIRSHYMAPDQDLINVVFKNQITILDINYNFQPLHYVFNAKEHARYFAQKGYYSIEEIEYAKENIKIVHFFRFLGQFPWHKNSLHPYCGIYKQYFEESNWKDYPLEESKQNSLVFRIERLLYKKCPKTLFLIIFKLNYEIFLWRANCDSLNNKNNNRM